MEKSIQQRTETALLAISVLRLRSSNIEGVTADMVIAEASRLERLFEEHWIENVHNLDYYDSLLEWVKEHQNDLKNPELYNGDYTEPCDKVRKVLYLTDHQLISRQSNYRE